MANVRKFLFMNPSEGFAQEQASTDELALAKITLSGADGVAIDAGGQLISNLGEPQASGDAARKVEVTTAQAAAETYADGIVATEQAAREAADNTLTSAITAETTARTNADNAITAAYEAADSAEEAARIAGDNTLQSNIDAEEAARISGDNTLSTALEAEASARASADSQLATDIDAEESARISADSSIRVDFAAADDVLEADYIARDVVVLDSAKAYADSLQSGFVVKAPARLILRSDSASLEGLSAIDGVTPVAGDRILVARETPSIDNGIYVAASGAWSRASDMDVTADFVDGVSVFVGEGTTYADSTWVLITNNPIVMDTTPVEFIQFSGLGQITAGQGLSKTGNTLDVNVGDGIAISADNVVVDLASNPALQFESGKLSVKPDQTRGLDKDVDGLFVKYQSEYGLEMAAAGLAVKADANYGLSMDPTTGIRVNLDTDPGLKFTNGALNVKNDVLRGIGKDANGLYMMINTEAALWIDGVNGLGVVNDIDSAVNIDPSLGIQVKPDTAKAISVSSDGVALELATDPGLEFTDGKLDHKLVSADRLTKSADGLDVAGVPAGFKIGGVATNSALSTAARLDTVLGGNSADAVHYHAKLISLVATPVAVDAGIAVYGSGTNAFAAASCSAAATARVQGVTVYASSLGQAMVQGAGPLSAFAGLTAGTPYYLGADGSMVEFSALESGDRVIRMGYAVNATTLNIMIQDLGSKA